MSKHDLEDLTKQELLTAARARGLAVGGTLSKAQLVELLLGLDGDENEEEDAQAEPVASPIDSEEVFATVSLARLLADQGLDRESADLCRAILERSPQEPRARELLQRLSRRPDPATAAVDSAAAARPAHRFTWSGVLLLAVTPVKLWVAWDISEEGDEPAARVAGTEITRVLRLFTARRGRRGIERTTRDFRLEGLRGRLFLDGCRPASSHIAAVGRVGDGDRFLPAAHSAVVWTPGQGSRGTSYPTRDSVVPISRPPVDGRSLDRLLRSWRSEVGAERALPEPDRWGSAGAAERARSSEGWLQKLPTSPGKAGGK